MPKEWKKPVEGAAQCPEGGGGRPEPPGAQGWGFCRKALLGGGRAIGGGAESQENFGQTRVCLLPGDSARVHSDSEGRSNSSLFLSKNAVFFSFSFKCLASLGSFLAVNEEKSLPPPSLFHLLEV